MPQEVALHLLNTKRDSLRAIEQRYGLTVQVLIGPDLTSSEFNLEKMRRSQSDKPERSESNDRSERNDRNDRRPRRDRNDRNDRDRGPRPVEAAAPEEAGNDNFNRSEGGEIEMMETPREDGFTTDVNGRKNNRSRRRRGGRNRGERGERGDRPAQVAPEGQVMNQDGAAPSENAPTTEFAPAQEGQPNSGRPPRSRGGRNRRPWRDRDDRGGQQVAATSEQQHSEPQQVAVMERNDGNTLPAFATEERFPVSPPQESAQIIPMEQTPSSNAAPKKGWWKKMIELDD